MAAGGRPATRPLLGTVVVFVVALAVGLGITVARHHRSAPGVGPSVAGGGPSATATLPAEIVPGPGQTFVTGVVTSLSADNAIGAPLRPPFTITIAARGRGSADFTGVSVAGRDVEIFWYGGQPLPVSGTGALAVDGGALTVDSSGSTWMLDGAARTVTAGHYHLGAPVAVGSGGLAEPHQSIAFDAGDRATVQTTGQARVHLAPAVLHLTGPGSVTIHGDLQARTSAAPCREVSTITFGPGSYSIDLTPTGAGPGPGDTINATLQGPVSLS